MTVTGIICEYNPFHTGHKKQIDAIRRLCGENSGIVCLMSGNFVQRGHPAIVDKSLRARAAVACGADLVLELPAQYSLSSAEGFAQGGVDILSHFCHKLCFGAENADRDALMNTAKALISRDFPSALRQHLDAGLSFPAARQRALEDMGMDASLLAAPNNILAVEYCKAILSRNSSMEILPISRGGSYHAEAAHRVDPSATAVRNLMMQGEDTSPYVPEDALHILEGGVLHTLHAGERAILARLRSMTEADFEALPYGSEGLWRKLMHAVREYATLEEILTAVKSKRYTRSRLDRMVMCAFLGLTQADLQTPPPYIRVLALSRRGGEILNKARQSLTVLNAGESHTDSFWQTEQRIGDLYGLFAEGAPEAPGAESRRRIHYFPK